MRLFNKINKTDFLLSGGVVGPLLFIVLFLIEDATRPGYSIFRNYVSDLSLSNQGWEQIVNFIICGFLCIGFAIGLKRIWPTGKASVWGPWLIGIFGLGLLIAGIFTIDPSRGYPPGAPLKGDPTSLHGYIHGINGLVVFTILPIACFVLARRFAVEAKNRRWATYCRSIGVLLFLISFLSTLSAPLAEKGHIAMPIGLIQRTQIIVGWTWISLTALRLLRQRHVKMITD